MSTNSDWLKVLKYLYTNNSVLMESVEVRGIPERMETKWKRIQRDTLRRRLLDEVNLSVENSRDVEAILNSLEKADMIRSRVDRDWAKIALEPDGFKIAQERELAQNQNRTNLALVLFTAVLIMSNVVSIFAETRVQILGGIVILGMVVAILVWLLYERTSV